MTRVKPLIKVAFSFVDKTPRQIYHLADMSEQMAAQSVNLFRGSFCHVQGALENQRSFLAQQPGQSIVSEPVHDSTIRKLHMARKDGTYTMEAPLPDVIHAIEGMRRQAASLIETSQAKKDIYAEFARIKGNGLRALANMMVNDVVNAYELSPHAQDELRTPMESRVEG